MTEGARRWSFEERGRCEACDGTRRRRLGLRGDRPLTASLRSDGQVVTTVYRCAQCGLVYCDPVPLGVSVEEVYGGVDDYFTIAIDDERLAYYRSLAEDLRRRTGRAGRLLDVGCGRGEFVYSASQVGWDAHGVDPDSAFVDFAKRRFGLTNVVAAELDEAGFADGSFDAITLNGVLEHIPRPRAALVHAVRLLAPGGILFFEVPNGAVLRFSAADAVLRLIGSGLTSHLSPFRPPFHLYEFSAAAARRMLDTVGLACEAVHFHPGKNRFPHYSGLRNRLLRTAYGALVAAENATGRTYNLHVYARRGE
jgi:2-polyprenyl-3-methyl-5-hydroxy-6-metoxy-1,4-benzoquinol methylase